MNPFVRRRWKRLARARHEQSSGFPSLADVLAAPLPDPRLLVSMAPLLAVDLEMTGLDSERHSIVSIGWVPIDNGAIDLGGCSEVGLVPNDGDAVGQSATIHGIRDCDRLDGVGLQQALERLVGSLNGRVAVFHHAPLDTAFLERAMRSALGVGWAWPSIDTLAWFRRRQTGSDPETGGQPAHLDAAREHYGLPPRTAHNALDDAISCAEVALILAAKSRARLGEVCDLPRIR